jgi:hypothetical protein
MGENASFSNPEIEKEIFNQDLVEIFKVGLQDGMGPQLLSKLECYFHGY